MSKEFQNVISKHPQAISKELATSEYQLMSDEYKKHVAEDVFVDFLSQTRRDNFLWHDYEAGGTDAKSVQPLQFAAIRTDIQHRIIDTPTDIYCKLAGDKLPHPVAIAITKINPLHCQSVGLPEPMFFRVIHSEMSMPSLCVVGYNSMGYDEEVTRFGFWRNLLPVYDREYSNFNSRWDLLPVTAAFKALNVPGITWPEREGGTSLKLENLAQANKITQESAHNALDDVKALIDWSALLKEKDESLWQYFFDNRRKKNMVSLMGHERFGVVFNAHFGSDKDFHAPILIIGSAPGESNKMVGIDLREIEALRACWRMDVNKIRELVYSKKDLLEAQGALRPPIQTFMLNKSPAFVSAQWCESNAKELWKPEWSDLVKKLSGASDFKVKLRHAFASDDFDVQGMDVEFLLYSAGFPSDRDKKNLMIITGESLDSAFSQPLEWDNSIYQVLWQRARCKLDGHGEVSLSNSERKSWIEHCQAQRSIEKTGGRHEHVNDGDVRQVLLEIDMDDELKSGYNDWLASLT